MLSPWIVYFEFISSRSNKLIVDERANWLLIFDAVR
jgi:hypothetical protein